MIGSDGFTASALTADLPEPLPLDKGGLTSYSA